MRETPFTLAFRTEAVIPCEVGIPSFRVNCFNPTSNDELLRMKLDLVEELRDEASVQNIAYQNQVRRYYNENVDTRDEASKI